ncbi:hypothetical protein [Chryseobacterium taichungense]|uniref:hypothetical protein n=1 Tax=Chryseobacterium taichungense TaxID=295069 RepID=UPI0028A6D972|nr:hypothetical protein [Chryseobacterium taichungense]
MKQLTLFNSEELYEFPKDLLEFREHFLNREEADLLKDKLLHSAPWEQRTQKMYNKTVINPRLTSWYGDDRKSYIWQLIKEWKENADTKFLRPVKPVP